MPQLFFQGLTRLCCYLVLLAPLAILPHVPEPFLTTKVLWLIFVVDILLLGLVIQAWRAKKVRAAITDRLRVSSIFLAALLYVAGLAVATFFGKAGAEGLYWGSFLRANGLFVLMHALFGGLALSYVLTTQELWNRFLKMSVVIACLSVVIGFIGRVFPTVPYIGNPGNMHGTFGNSGFFSGYLLLHLVFGALATSAARTKREQWLWGVSLILLFVGLLFTASRASFLGLMVGLFVLLVESWRVLASWVRTGVLILVALFIIAQFVPTTWLPRAFVINPAAITSQTRLLYWDTAWEAFKERPILGWGRGGYAAAFAQYFDPRIQEVSFGDIFTDDSHNTFLNTAVEAGIIGLSALLLIFGMLCWYALRVLARAKDLRIVWHMRVAFAGIVAYATYSFFSVEQPVVLFFFWALAGYVYWHNRTQEGAVGFSIPWTPRMGIWLQWVGVAALLGVFVLSVSVTKDMAAYAAAARMQQRAAWFTWARELEKIKDSSWRTYQCEWWMYSVRSFLSPRIYHRLANDVAIRAASALENHVEACTNNGTHFYRTNLTAQFFVRVGDLRTTAWYAKAIQWYEKALALSPNNVQVSYGLAEVYLSLGESEKAIALLEQRRDTYPEIAQTYWYLSLAYKIHNEPEKAEAAAREALQRGFVPRKQ